MRGNACQTESVTLRVAQYLAVHDGVIEYAQAIALGMSDYEVRRRVALGLWIKHAHAVFLSAEHRLTDTARLRIAVAATGGVIDRTAAAWLYGFIKKLPDVITLSVPRSRHADGDIAVDVTCKRRSFPSEDVGIVCGLPTVRVPLTLLQLASEMPTSDAITIIDRSIQTGEATPRQLRAALDRNKGAHGMRDARILLVAAEDDSESEAERLFVRILRRHGIEGWKQQVWLEGHRLDFMWPELKVVVSIHGWKFHRHHDRWDSDLRTSNMLRLMGYLELSFPWHRLKFEEEDVVRELTAALNQSEYV